jgi:hypothetical protein
MRPLVPALLGGLAIVALLSVLCVVRARKLGVPPSLAEISRVGESSFPPERDHGFATDFLWFDVPREESTSDTSAVLSSTG